MVAARFESGDSLEGKLGGWMDEWMDCWYDGSGVVWWYCTVRDLIHKKTSRTQIIIEKKQRRGRKNFGRSLCRYFARKKDEVAMAMQILSSVEAKDSGLLL